MLSRTELTQFSTRLNSDVLGNGTGRANSDQTNMYKADGLVMTGICPSSKKVARMGRMVDTAKVFFSSRARQDKEEGVENLPTGWLQSPRNRRSHRHTRPPPTILLGSLYFNLYFIRQASPSLRLSSRSWKCSDPRSSCLGRDSSVEDLLDDVPNLWPTATLCKKHLVPIVHLDDLIAVSRMGNAGMPV